MVRISDMTVEYEKNPIGIPINGKRLKIWYL